MVNSEYMTFPSLNWRSSLTSRMKTWMNYAEHFTHSDKLLFWVFMPINTSLKKISLTLVDWQLQNAALIFRFHSSLHWSLSCSIGAARKWKKTFIYTKLIYIHIKYYTYRNGILDSSIVYKIQKLYFKTVQWYIKYRNGNSKQGNKKWYFKTAQWHMKM